MCMPRERTHPFPTPRAQRYLAPSLLRQRTQRSDLHTIRHHTLLATPKSRVKYAHTAIYVYVFSCGGQLPAAVAAASDQKTRNK